MSWNTSSVFAPVGLVLRGRETHTVVRTLGDAAYLLIRDWPFDDGEEYMSPFASGELTQAAAVTGFCM